MLLDIFFLNHDLLSRYLNLYFHLVCFEMQEIRWGTRLSRIEDRLRDGEHWHSERAGNASHSSSLWAHTSDPFLPYVPENSFISLQVFDTLLNRGIDQSWSCRVTDRRASVLGKSNVKKESKVKFSTFNSCSWVWLMWTRGCCLTIWGLWFLFLLYFF